MAASTPKKIVDTLLQRDDDFEIKIDDRFPGANPALIVNHPSHGKLIINGARDNEHAKEIYREYFAPKNKPQKTVGEDLTDFYNKEFFKEANGNRDAFIEHHINRFGIPKGSSRAKEVEHYGSIFDKLSKGDK